ncbi:helix-turn-helix domain-containing protein [Streptomyces chrestomyceticus]|uniref:helix-turn-helix domain-containing protein n=1 Tax=Streptomyces chrestomyceticus TaxID=68185 RepID=UPI00379F0501
MDTRGSTDPAEARDVAEFLAMLRELKERRGLTYRQLEQRAAEQGEVLARSTLADVLSGRRLPRPEVLSVFVRACGESRDRASAWLDARADVAARSRTAKSEPAPAGSAATEQTPPQAAAAPEDAAARPRNTRRAPLLIASAIVLVLATAATAWRAASGGMSSGNPPSGSPSSHAAPQSKVPSRNAAIPAGWIRIRPAGAPTLCVTDGRVQDGRYNSLVAVQRPCGGVAPQRTELEPVGTGTYRIAWVHPEHGKGCLKALSGGTADGLLEPWESCAQASSFRVEPDRGSGPASGSGPGSDSGPGSGPGPGPSGSTRQANGGKPARYIFRTDGEQCLGVRDARTATGAEVTLQRCTGRENQTFLIDPAP